MSIEGLIIGHPLLWVLFLMAVTVTLMYLVQLYKRRNMPLLGLLAGFLWLVGLFYRLIGF